MGDQGENEGSAERVPLLSSVRSAAGLLKPAVQRIENYRWTGGEDNQFWEFIKRAIIKRQSEALDTTIHLSENGMGHFGVTLLRPAYEERLWSQYLLQHKDLAPQIIMQITRKEIRDAIEAQDQFIGARAMQSIGFSRNRIKQMRKSFGSVNEELRDIGKKLNWRDGGMPSVAKIARETGNEKEYNFLYHATSRYVHFSTHELGRRVWGSRGDVAIGSDKFSDYWSDFALYWSFRIFFGLLRDFYDTWADESIDISEEIGTHIKNMYPVPMITASELESW